MKAIFQLQERQARAFRPYQREDGTDTIGASPLAPQMKSSLTQKWTNNELLMVGCCGIIKSHATCYESESISNAKVSLYASAESIMFSHLCSRILFWLHFHLIYMVGTHRSSFTTTTANWWDTCWQQTILISPILASLLMSSMQSRNTRTVTNFVKSIVTLLGSPSFTMEISGFSIHQLQNRPMAGLGNFSPQHRRCLRFTSISFLTRWLRSRTTF